MTLLMNDRNEKSEGTNGPGGPTTPPGSSGGFFSIYKKGQGQVTRVVTAIVAAALIVLITHWIFDQLRLHLAEWLITPNRTRDAAAVLAKNISLGVSVGLTLAAGAVAWKLMNAPRGAEFLITTDAEMKRVNWASRKEIIGSTRVVVLFLAFICAFLFAADILFGYFFQLIGVLKTGPFG